MGIACKYVNATQSSFCPGCLAKVRCPGIKVIRNRKKDMFKNYEEAYRYFYGKKNHFWDLGLTNIKEFLKRIGSPENKINIIQVAGTNGKGSVSAFMANILTESGYKVGRYNSPVVFEERENITINNVPMSEDEFTCMVNDMYDAMEMAEKEEKLPTIFELETAMAISYFHKVKCDIVILEAGLGGETDATNVSENNILSVITSISLDHMNYLGDTIEKIATVKSGIIKQDSSVILGINKPSVEQVIKSRAEQNNSRLYAIKKESITEYESTLSGQRFSYVTSAESGKKYENIQIRLLGRNQVENAAQAIEAVTILADKLKNLKTIPKAEITEKSIRDGLKYTEWKGRFQVISDEPLIIIDGAHNPDAAKRLKENIEIFLDGYNIVFVMGVFADKNYAEIIDIMKPYMYRGITVTVPGTRALDAYELKLKIQEIMAKNQKTDFVEDNIEVAKAYDEAVETAKKMAEQYTKENGRKTVIVAFGSLSYLKYIMQSVQKKQ